MGALPTLLDQRSPPHEAGALRQALLDGGLAVTRLLGSGVASGQLQREAAFGHAAEGVQFTVLAPRSRDDAVSLSVTKLPSRNGIASAYAAADVFVFPSRTDTFGPVMIEALASGVPIAAYPVPGPLDIVARQPCPRAADLTMRAPIAGLVRHRGDHRADRSPHGSSPRSVTHRPCR